MILRFLAALPAFLAGYVFASVPPHDFNAGSSAEFCGGCHRAIDQAWRNSAHAQAMGSRLFQDALELAGTAFGSAGRKTCLGCHAPMAVRMNDLALTRKLSWEGVTCDYCHSVMAVNMSVPNPVATLSVSNVKTGPIKDSPADGHRTAFSAVHTTSAICAPCHEYRNSLGFPVLTTVSEWKASLYPKQGTQCQTCHMGRVAGEVVDPRVSRSSMAKINLHHMPGSHSLEQLNSAIKAQLSAIREAGTLQVIVDVSNQAAGHYLPTGSPLRQLMLEVRADTESGQHFRGERIYARTIADDKGAPVTMEYMAFLTGAKLISDTRLAPGEKRKEVFSYAIPKGTKTQVKATFSYFYSPMARSETGKRITFLTLTRIAN